MFIEFSRLIFCVVSYTMSVQLRGGRRSFESGIPVWSFSELLFCNLDLVNIHAALYVLEMTRTV